MQKNLGLFGDRRFWPLMVTMFCGCLNDCILKNALIILIIYKIASSEADLLVLLINSMFILPFIIFAGVAGQISDKYEKALLIRIIKFSEIFIILLGLIGFYYSHLATLILSITLMGIHSAFFGTLKLSIIPDQLEQKDFMLANGYIEMGTFIGVLAGTFLGGLYTWHQQFVMVLMLIVACGGFISSLFIIKSPNYDSKVVINPNLWKGATNILKECYMRPKIFLSILAISWFWFMGASILSQIPVITKTVFGCDESVANLFLGVFSIGTGLGSLLCSKILKNNLSTKYIVASAIGMSILGVDLYFLTRTASSEVAELMNITTFLAKLESWHIMLNLMLFSTLGGIYVVPLYTIVQSLSLSDERARMIAANNLMNAIFIMGSAILIGALLYIGCSISFVILILSLLNLMVAGYIYAFLPAQEPLHIRVVAGLIRVFMNIFYKVEVTGLENYHKAGDRVVIISNHVSYLDATLLSVYMPERPVFAINRMVAQKWWIKIFLKLIKAHPVDNDNPLAIKNLIREVQNKKKVAIFPEGRLSTTGKLMKTYAGPAIIAQKSKAKILPVVISGPEHTIFATARSMPIRRLFYKVKMHIMPPVSLDGVFDSAVNKTKYAASWLYDLMLKSSLEASEHKKPLFAEVALAAKTYGLNYQILEDASWAKRSYGWVIAKALQFADLIKKRKCVGLLLDNTSNSIPVLLGSQIAGAQAVILNRLDINSACEKYNIEEIYASGGLPADAPCVVHIIEDILTKTPLLKRIKYFLKSRNLDSLIKKADGNNAIIFSDNLRLSCENLTYNINQAANKLDLNVNDKVFCPLPLFDTLGFQIALTSITSGVKLFIYPSDLDSRTITEAIYGSDVTIIFGTDQLLSYYGQIAHSYDFSSVRYVFVYGERLNSATSDFWQQNFGIRILPLYALEKASSVLALSTKMEYKAGSVGKLLPGIEYKLQKFKCIEDGGKLFIRGKNISHDQWIDTGDIVKVDEEKYVTVLGRADQFWQKDNTLISLPLLEDVALKIDPSEQHAAIKMGKDQIALFSTSSKVDKKSIEKIFKKDSISSLNAPAEIHTIDKLPLLANHRVDYDALKSIIKDKI
ncbi:acylglycerophosphoethanolamine acyltransferase [Candidatus Phycorickettsia trachydisci]|uniref:Acylglycerophosphoethanolamine acyltransferase n=1 Tax=Candidatus Phycorickettsia trachydisci TaxID=2115978 RepID=A0A2P1PA76_9RICK|nr:MFS transporter [Candidatus Phycorickettsia trachydisci]AVP88168.1 acylglycerophosphoethanolamine acyltransferase [Candidatus Phycorickettsia trachydisci]